MKKKSSLQLILMFIFTVATIISCKNDSASTTEENPFGDVTSIAEITSTPAKNVDSLFVFTTAGGRMFIMANAEAANKINEEFQNEGFHLGGLGVGTAFIINERGETLLCTATHCAEGLEKFSKNVKYIRGPEWFRLVYRWWYFYFYTKCFCVELLVIKF